MIMIRLFQRYDPYEEFDKIRDTIIIFFPYLSPILRRVKPQFIKARNFTASVVDQVDRVVINVNWWRRLDTGEKAFIILHEALHLALQHGVRGRKYSYPLLFNIAADAIVNELILEAVREARRRGVRGVERIRPPFPYVSYQLLVEKFNLDIPYERFIKMSVDELYYLLLRKTGGRSIKLNIVEDTSTPPPPEARVLYPSGSENRNRNVESSERRESTSNTASSYEHSNDMIRAVEESMRLTVLYKAAGRETATICRAFENLLKPRIDWRRILREQVELALHGRTISTWRRPNRKIDDLPGKRHLAPIRPCIYCLLDVSGSILAEPNLLDQFLSEVASIARTSRGKIILVTWSSKIRQVIEIDNPETIMEKLRQAAREVGGGTVVDHALRKAIALAYKTPRNRNILILLSDGIWNNDHPELFREVEKYFTKLIYVYTVEPHPELENWTRIQLTAS